MVNGNDEISLTTYVGHHTCLRGPHPKETEPVRPRHAAPPPLHLEEIQWLSAGPGPLKFGLSLWPKKQKKT